MFSQQKASNHCKIIYLRPVTKTRNLEGSLATVFCGSDNFITVYSSHGNGADATLLVGYLSEQIMFLQTHHHMTFIGLNISDILVINKNIFVIASDANILAFDPHTNRVDFELPFIKPQFTSNAIQEVTMIPASVEIDTNNTAQYCVAALVASLIDMESIKYTKLYWCLERTLNRQISIYV